MITDFLLGRGADDDIAVIDGDRKHTYLQLRRASRQLVAALKSAGVEPGDRIALLGANSFFWAASYLAALRLGVVVPLSDKLGPAELQAQVDWAGCTALLADRRQLRRAGQGLCGLVTVTDATLDAGTAEDWEPSHAGPGDDAALVFTSGTTSRPKAVRLTQRNLLANTSSIMDYLGLAPDDRMLVVLPFHYVFGASLLHTHLASGGSLVLCHSFAYPETALDLVDEHGCTGLAGVPSSYQLLLRASSFRSRRLPSLRTLQQAGGRLGPELVAAVAAAQPQARMFVMYGATEATARLSYLPPEFLSAKPGSIGRGIPGVTLRVVGAGDRDVGPGEQGEIIASGDNISPGYHRDPEGSAEKFHDGWLRTGDLAVVDDDGFIQIVGRSGDFIKSWGHRISPLQVEEAALRHPAVAMAVALGMPDESAGEAVVLAVAPAPGEALDAAALLALLRVELPKHMVPARLHVLPEIPLTAAGKVSRSAVKSLLETT